jgi:hypothetical protein
MHRGIRGLLAACAIGLAFVAPAAAQGPKQWAQIKFVPGSSHPPIPAGLKVTCLKGPNVLTSSNTCPVVVYQGITTWAYSFLDNRVSMALVSYDAGGNVVRNVTKDGTRYVWNMTSGIKSKLVTIFGQSNQFIEVPWDQLGPAR